MIGECLLRLSYLAVEFEPGSALLALLEVRPVLIVVIGIHESDLEAHHVGRRGAGEVGGVFEHKGRFS